MSIILFLIAGVVLETISDVINDMLVRIWKHNHYKRSFVNGGWKL